MFGPLRVEGRPVATAEEGGNLEAHPGAFHEGDQPNFSISPAAAFCASLANCIALKAHSMSLSASALIAAKM
jgi:uncharacterized OsmC-like protein